MKLSRKAIAGIVVGFVGVITVSLFFIFLPRNFTYSKMKVDISILRLLKPNFKTLSFRSDLLFEGKVTKTTLLPIITVNTGNPADYGNVIKAAGSDTVLRFSSRPPFSKYDVSLVQIDSLLAIPGVAYFIVVANKYPPSANMVAYTILPYNAKGGLIVMNKAFLRLNPCPPAVAYQATDQN